MQVLPRTALIAVWLAAACTAKGAAPGPAPQDSAPLAPAQGAFDEANAAFQAGRYAEAAAAYERALADPSADVQAGGDEWEQYGYALHVSGELQRAIEAHERATEFPKVAPVAAYYLGCAHALLGHKDEAFAALDRAVGFGFKGIAQLEGDPDLSSLHSDPRWELLRDRVATAAGGG